MTFLRTVAGIAAFMLLVFLLTGPAVDVEQATGSPPEAGGIGTAAVYGPDGLTREYGDGLIRVNGHGPEWHRWEKVKGLRRETRLERENARLLRSNARLRRTVGRSFIPSYWVKIASCESGVSWTYNGSSGFDGAVQFHPGTWSANRLRGYPAFAYQASPFQQLVVAEIVLAHSGWGQWPACSRKVGLR